MTEFAAAPGTPGHNSPEEIAKVLLNRPLFSVTWKNYWGPSGLDVSIRNGKIEVVEVHDTSPDEEPLVITRHISPEELIRIEREALATGTISFPEK